MVNLKKLKAKKTIQELLEFGIININKSSGKTSFDVSDFVNKTLKPFSVRKTSHFGTLDPKVTGVLPIALNRACKLTGFFIGEDKEYIGIMRVHREISLKEIEKKIKEKFLGKIIQMPPVKSRVKRQNREREIKKFKLLEREDKDLLFISEVQGGTYIRKLIDDLGKELGIGAHMLELRRIRAGIFKENDEDYPSVNLYDFVYAVKEYKKGNEKLLREILIPAEIVSRVYPFIKVKKESLKKLFTGRPILKEDLEEHEKFENNKIISVFSDEKFVGMYEVLNEGYIFAKPKFVLQQIGEKK